MNEQMFDRDLRLEVMIHDGEGRIYSAYTFELGEGAKIYRRLFLAVMRDQNNVPRPYWTGNPEKAYRTMDAMLLGAYVRELLKFTDYKVVYIAEKDNGLITCLAIRDWIKRKGGNNDQQ